MNNTDGYDANKDPAFMTSEDELEAGPLRDNSWKIPERFVGPAHSSQSELTEVNSDTKAMAI